MNPPRFAIVRNAGQRDRLEAFLPSNYSIVGQLDADTAGTDSPVYVIAGQDYAGWTMDEYVIPRLGSGLIFATEITPIETEGSNA